MKAEIRMEGLDRLRRMAGSGVRVIDTEMQRGLREIAPVLRGQAISNVKRFATDGRLARSIRYRLKRGELVLGSQAATGLSIEQGRKPGEHVRFGLILGWAQRRGLARAVFTPTRGRSGRGTEDLIDAKQRRFAFKVVQQIRARGTSPLPFLIRAAHQKRDHISRTMNDSLGRAVQRLRQTR